MDRKSVELAFKGSCDESFEWPSFLFTCEETAGKVEGSDGITGILIDRVMQAS